MFKLLFTLVAAITFSDGFAQTTAKEWYNRGIALKAEKDYEDASTAFKTAISLNGDYVEAMHQLGWCYNELQEYDNAAEALLKEYNAGPADKAANCFELGYAYRHMGKIQDALQYINIAIGIDGKYAAAYKERGLVYYADKKYTEALADFNTYQSLSTTEIKDADFYFKKGWMENDAQKYYQALISLQKSAALNGSLIDVFNEMGYANTMLKNNNAALQNYRTALALDDANEDALLGLADVFFDIKNNDDSCIYYYEKVLPKRPSDKRSFYRLGWCYNDKSDFSDAMTALHKAISIDADYVDAKKELGFAYYKQKQYDFALAIFERIINSDADDSFSRYYAGFCYYFKNDKVSLKKMIAQLNTIGTYNSTEYAATLAKYVK